uniref:Uncharacterized protein n=1 Tax=Cyprinus carpio TaxID=7962 RepID=A0A8C1ZS12_CYPCA
RLSYYAWNKELIKFHSQCGEEKCRTEAHSTRQQSTAQHNTAKSHVMMHHTARHNIIGWKDIQRCTTNQSTMLELEFRHLSNIGYKITLRLQITLKNTFNSVIKLFVLLKINLVRF